MSGSYECFKNDLVCSDAHTQAAIVRGAKTACVPCSRPMCEPVQLREWSCQTGESLCVVRISGSRLHMLQYKGGHLNDDVHSCDDFNEHFTLLWTDKYTKGCPASQTFSYQLQRCQLTCMSLSSERQGCHMDFLPVDGCSCPDGLYLNDKGICVAMAKCPCYHNGVHIKPGKSINIKDEHW